MVTSLPAAYVEKGMAMGHATAFPVLGFGCLSLRIIIVIQH